MSTNRLILWDIDGTLMHCGSDGTKALNRTFAELYDINDAFEKASIGGAMDYTIIHDIMETFRIDAGDFFKITEHYREVLGDILLQNQEKRVLPGVIPLLSAIENQPRSLNALLTSNLQIGAETKLKSVGLSNYFKIGGYGDEPGEKWHAAERCIQTAEDHMKTTLSRQEIFLFGDSIYDLDCAKRLGIRSVAVATGWAEEKKLLACKPDYFFKDLTETHQVLKVLELVG